MQIVKAVAREHALFVCENARAWLNVCINNLGTITEVLIWIWRDITSMVLGLKEQANGWDLGRREGWKVIGE